jgi:hypothetical protein
MNFSKIGVFFPGVFSAGEFFPPATAPGAQKKAGQSTAAATLFDSPINLPVGLVNLCS